jgi:uncharacterized protein
MKRFAEKYLNSWIDGKRRKVLVIRGARQVGKSTLVRNFATNRHMDLLEINLEQYPSSSIWQSMQGKKIIREIELAVERKVTSNTLLFIDEIQNCPSALSALRYLNEEVPALPVIAAGSLLEFVLGETELSMPVGRISYFHLGPMTFREVLLAKGKELLEESLYQIDFKSPSLSAFNNLKEYYKEYIFTGGLPEAVQVGIDEDSILASREIHRSIISTYKDDFGKYKKKISPEIINVIFNHIPLHLGQKVKYANISRDIPSRQQKEAIDALIKARIALPAYHTSCAGIPLKATMDSSVYKLYFLDVGLSAYMSGLGWDDFITNDNSLINKGNISEQFIAQHLAYRDEGLESPELYYWLREGKSTNAEVDFVISDKGKPVIIEVKSGKSGSLRSVHQLIAKTGLKTAHRFDINPPSRQNVHTFIQNKEGQQEIEFELISYPAYMIETFQSMNIISSPEDPKTKKGRRAGPR